jgi:hypothetical protein
MRSTDRGALVIYLDMFSIAVSSKPVTLPSVCTLNPELWFQEISISISSWVITPLSKRTNNSLALKISAII